MSNCITTYFILAVQGGTKLDPCNTTKEQQVFYDSHKGIPEEYPMVHGPFDGGGQKGCTFKVARPNEAGEMVCKDRTLPCKKDDTPSTLCHPGDSISWRPFNICS